MSFSFLFVVVVVAIYLLEGIKFSYDPATDSWLIVDEKANRKREKFQQYYNREHLHMFITYNSTIQLHICSRSLPLNVIYWTPRRHLDSVSKCLLWCCYCKMNPSKNFSHSIVTLKFTFITTTFNWMCYGILVFNVNFVVVFNNIHIA